MKYSLVRKCTVITMVVFCWMSFPTSAFSPRENVTDCLNDDLCGEEKILESGSKLERRRPERPRCKNVTLSSDQFHVLGDESLHVPLLNETFDQWLGSPNNEKAVICAPFTEEFLSCRRWMLSPNEFEITHGGLRLWVPDYNRVYETGEFYLRPGNEAVVCMEIVDSETPDKNEIVLPLGITWVLSAVSLIAALPLCLVFLRTSYRFLLPFYMVNLFVGYVILIRRAFGPIPTINECTVYGILLQFSLLSAFFWLNVVAFHVWRCVAKIQKGLEPGMKFRHLFGYVLYGWGLPFFITLISFLIDAGELFPEVQWLRPQFQSNCWFGARLPTLIFFYVPMALVLSANVVFFSLSIVNIRDATKYYSCKPGVSKKKLIGTVLHLMVIMGLCWTMEALSWAIAGNPRFWYFTDLLNGLQGFFVLLVVITDTRLIFKIPYFRKHDEDRSVSSSVTDVSTVSYDEKPTSSSEKK